MQGIATLATALTEDSQGLSAESAGSQEPPPYLHPATSPGAGSSGSGPRGGSGPSGRGHQAP